MFVTSVVSGPVILLRDSGVAAHPGARPASAQASEEQPVGRLRDTVLIPLADRVFGLHPHHRQRAKVAGGVAPGRSAKDNPAPGCRPEHVMGRVIARRAKDDTTSDARHTRRDVTVCRLSASHGASYEQRCGHDRRSAHNPRSHRASLSQTEREVSKSVVLNKYWARRLAILPHAALSFFDDRSLTITRTLLLHSHSQLLRSLASSPAILASTLHRRGSSLDVIRDALAWN